MYAFLAAPGAILLSFLDITVMEGEAAIRPTFTGVLVPIGVAGLLLLIRMVRARKALIVTAVASAIAYPSVEVAHNGVFMEFPM